MEADYTAEATKRMGWGDDTEAFGLRGCEWWCCLLRGGSTCLGEDWWESEFFSAPQLREISPLQ